MADHETSDAADEVGRTPQDELSRRLRLLLDVAVGENGRPLLFLEISQAMTARGVKLSRARWNYMKDGIGRLIPDRSLLVALADYFNVDPDYLLRVEDVTTHELTASQRESVKALRAKQVKSFMAKTLGEVSPQTLAMIIGHLDQEAALPPGGEATVDERGTPDERPGVL